MRAHSGFARAAMAGFAGLLFGGTTAARAAEAATVAREKPAPPPGASVDGELAGGQADAYSFAVPGGHYLRVVVLQQGLDLVIRLMEPAGRQLLEVDNPGLRFGPELVERVAETPSVLRLEVEPREPDAPPRPYRLTVDALRPAAEADGARAAIRAEALRRVREIAELEAAQQAVGADATLAQVTETCETVARLWREAGDRHGETSALRLCGSTLAAIAAGEEPGLSRSDEALAIAEGAGDRRLEAEVLYGRGLVLERRDRRGEAVAAYQRSLATWEQVDDAWGQAFVLNRIGLVRSQAAELEPAREALSRSLALWRLVGFPRGEVETQGNLGVVLWRLGEPLAALENFEESLPKARALRDGTSIAYLLLKMGPTVRSLGRLHRALECYQEALPLFRAAGRKDREAAVLSNLGLLYSHLGQTERAREYFQLAHGRFLELGNLAGQAKALHDLGWAQERLGLGEDAESSYRRSLELSLQARDRSREAYARYSLGSMAAKQGDAEKGLAFLTQALVLRQESSDRRGEVQTLNAIAEAHRRQGDWQRAEEGFSAAFSLSEQLLDPIEQARTLEGWARLRRDRGDLAAALAKAQRAVEIEESLRRGIVGEDFRMTFLASRHGRLDLLIDVLMRLDEQQPQRGYAQRAAAVSERAHARSLVELLAESEIEIERGLPPELKQRKGLLESRLSMLQRELVGGSWRGPDREARVTALEAERSKALDELNDLKRDLREANAEYAQVHYPEPLDAEGIAAQVPRHAALLEYALGAEASFLFVFTREGFRAFRLDQAQEIDGLVAELRRAIVSRRFQDWYPLTSTARRLFEILLAPALETLGEKEHLIIVPDRRLYHLPFEVLLDAAPPGPSGRYDHLPFALRRWRFSYVPSATVLASLGQRASRSPTAPEKDLVAFGDPLAPATPALALPAAAVSRPAGQGQASLPPLAASRREVEEIARLFSPERTQVYLGREASKRNVLDNPFVRSARYLHFATHGLIDEEFPAGSALFLSSDGNGAGSELLLQLHDIFNLELGAELVVLSACESGLGGEVRGEGIIGLTRAFLYAGARSIAVSLWKVGDSSTAELMTSFYRELQQGKRKAEALQRAKLALVRGGDRLSHPAYWSAFILVGEAPAGELR